MPATACIIGDNALALWGLDSRRRIRRQLDAVGVHEVIDAAAASGGAAPGSLLVVNADYLFEARTFTALLRRPGALLMCPADGRVAAAMAPPGRAAAFTRLVAGERVTTPSDAEPLEPAALDAYDDELRRNAPPLLEPLAAHSREALESLLYGNAYKGITDLVTKWWWPRPARRIVALCADAGITPNMVTVAGVILMLATCALFAVGHYLLGLASGWIMTLLDTVDGKLARVTVRSSRLGHVLDHGMDILHPPFWYVLWGSGLDAPTVAGWSVTGLDAAIVVGYVGGRVAEGLFHALGRCSLFAWRPFDAYFRLVAARRNPCLIVLTACVLAGRPDLGFLGVAAWTILSASILALRLLYAAVVRLSGQPLESWLKDPAAAHQHAATYRLFSDTRSAYE